MPQLYQGALLRGRPKAAEALEAGERRFDSGWGTPRLDAHLTWRSLSALRIAREHVPENFEGFWIRVRGGVPGDAMDALEDWLPRLAGGRLTIQLPAAALFFDLRGPLHGVDHGHEMSARWIGLRADLPSDASAQSLAQAERSVAIAYADLAPMVGEARDFEAWKADAAGLSPLVGQRVRGVVLGLRAPIDEGTEAQALHALARLETRLGPSTEVELHARGQATALQAASAVLDGEGGHSGIVTGYLQTPLSAEVVRTLIESPTLRPRFSDWGLRWSNLSWPGGEIELSGAWFVHRRSGRVVDRLQLWLAAEDPSDPAFKMARAELADHVDPALERGAAWLYEGPTIDSALGRRYQRLVKQLIEVRDAVGALEDPLPTPARRLNPLRRIADALERGHTSLRAPARTILEAIDEVTTGFRHDRSAHPSETSFLEFTRSEGASEQRICFTRSHRPPMFTIQLAVSPFRTQVVDLEPSRGRVTPGVVVELDELAPSRAPLVWRMGTRSELAAALRDVVVVLRARALPFFDQADAVLQAWRADKV